jgi:DNA-binding FadR family transcriptional regulator
MGKSDGRRDARLWDSERTAAKGCLPISPSDGVLRALKTSETVARDLVHDIVERGLRTGDNLAHEAAMIDNLGVSRESLREALRLLEVQGLITIRRGPGGGPSVGEVSPANLGRTASLYYHLAGATLGELLEAWVLAESTLAELAARHPDRQRVRDAMGPFVDEHDDEGLEDLEEFVRSRSQFHAVLGSLADNRVLELMLQTVGQIVTHQFVGIADPRPVHSVIADDHVALARAVIAGHARKAQQLMEAHIRHVADYYVAELGARVNDYVEWR